MARTKDQTNASQIDASQKETNLGTHLSSLEEMILRMRFGLGKDQSADAFERDISDELRKKLQFLELKAFEQSGRINELLGDIEKKRQKR